MIETCGDRHVWPGQPTVIHSFTIDNDCGVTIYQEPGDDRFWVSWTDFVANSWREPHTTLSQCWVRVATLQRCAEDGFSTFFNEGVEFDPTVDEFFAKVLR